MARICDRDTVLESLNNELRTLMSALNEECHPVDAPRSQRVTALEVAVTAIKQEINERRMQVDNDNALPINRRDAEA